MTFDAILMLAASESGGMAASPDAGPDLITNGGFATAAGWVLTQQAGTQLPTISGGLLNSTAASDGNFQRASQTLAGGSSPPGSYRITLDTTLGGTDPSVYLLGAGGENRGSAEAFGSGTEIAKDVLASGEVSEVMIEMQNSGAVDNVKLQRLP